MKIENFEVVQEAMGRLKMLKRFEQDYKAEKNGTVTLQSCNSGNTLGVPGWRQPSHNGSAEKDRLVNRLNKGNLIIHSNLMNGITEAKNELFIFLKDMGVDISTLKIE